MIFSFQNGIMKAFKNIKEQIMTYKENYQKWLAVSTLPDYLMEELKSMDDKTMEDAFYTNLEFGTAGMRGYIGAGTNRINIYVVRQATEGLAKLVESKGQDAKDAGIAIAYDSRHFSPEFAFESAQVLAAHGIKSYVFESLRPTPELSFAVRHLGAFAGIMITASHNPAPFNGYKVYGADKLRISDTIVSISAKAPVPMSPQASKLNFGLIS